jgi:hypothetical protein
VVIGSPMYSTDPKNYDIGRIDVYIRKKKKLYNRKSEFEFKHLVILGTKARSRFGTTLAKLGDTNDDEFNGLENFLF